MLSTAEPSVRAGPFHSNISPVWVALRDLEKLQVMGSLFEMIPNFFKTFSSQNSVVTSDFEMKYVFLLCIRYTAMLQGGMDQGLILRLFRFHRVSAPRILPLCLLQISFLPLGLCLFLSFFLKQSCLHFRCWLRLVCKTIWKKAA